LTSNIDLIEIEEMKIDYYKVNAFIRAKLYFSMDSFLMRDAT